MVFSIENQNGDLISRKLVAVEFDDPRLTKVRLGSAISKALIEDRPWVDMPNGEMAWAPTDLAKFICHRVDAPTTDLKKYLFVKGRDGHSYLADSVYRSQERQIPSPRLNYYEFRITNCSPNTTVWLGHKTPIEVKLVLDSENVPNKYPSPKAKPKYDNTWDYEYRNSWNTRRTAF